MATDSSHVNFARACGCSGVGTGGSFGTFGGSTGVRATVVGGVGAIIGSRIGLRFVGLAGRNGFSAGDREDDTQAH